jgi:hypothetical protein
MGPVRDESPDVLRNRIPIGCKFISESHTNTITHIGKPVLPHTQHRPLTP